MPRMMNNNKAVEKPAKGTFLKSLIKLLKFCKKYWGWIILSMVFGAIAVVFQIIGPNKIGDIANIIGNYENGIDIGAVTEIGIFFGLHLCRWCNFVLFSTLHHGDSDTKHRQKTQARHFKKDKRFAAQLF